MRCAITTTKMSIGTGTVAAWLVSCAGLTVGASADVLYNNGSIVTAPGGGFGGADLSRANSNVNAPDQAYGQESFHISTGRNAKVADDFTVGGTGWAVTSITGYALIQDGAYPTPPVT